MSIQIYDSKELPFGPLSNNSIYIMEIEGQTYNTVTNYIYANLLKSKDYFSIMKNISVYEIQKYFTKYDKETRNNIIAEALYEALDIKLKNKNLEDLLLTTDNYPIIYKSDNDILDDQKTWETSNLLGKYLTKIRDELHKKYESKETRLYNAYTALQILENLIRQENNDLTEFIGLNHNEIINKFIYIKALENSNIQKIDLSPFTYEQIIDKYKNVVKYPSKNILELLAVGDNIQTLNLLDKSLQKNDLLVMYARKKYLKNLQQIQKIRIKNEVFDIYVNDMIKIQFPSLSRDKYQEIKDRELAVDYKELDVLKDQIFTFYTENLLPRNVMEEIINDSTIDLSNIVSDEDVVMAENENLEDIYNIVSNVDSNITIIIENDKTITNNPYSAFSPYVYLEMLNINGNYYPTVMHYIIAKLLSNLPDINTIDNAHKYLLINIDGDVTDNINYNDYDSLSYLYEDLKYYQYNNLKKKLASIALNKKFENQSLMDLLIVTNNKFLTWNDKNDDVLGYGITKNGENFVGAYLMELRKKFKKIEDTSKNITHEDIIKIIENDIFMRSWLEMRLTDICKVVKHAYNYILTKNNLSDKLRIQAKYNKRWKFGEILNTSINGLFTVKFNNGVIIEGITQKDIRTISADTFEIDVEFVNNVLDNIYQPCYEIMKDIKYLDIATPVYFIDLVKKCFGSHINPEINGLLWKRIIIMVYFILKYVPKIADIKNILAKLELTNSNKTKCVKIINNDEDNCILSAIFNILKGLIELNNIYEYDSNVLLIDIQTAVNIILNRKHIKLEDKTVTFTGIDNVSNQPLQQDIYEKPYSNTGDFDDYVEGEDDLDSDNDDFDYLKSEDEEEESYLDETNEEYDGADIEFINRIRIEHDEKQRKNFERQKNINKITLYMESSGLLSKNNKVMSEYILDAIHTIKKYKMSHKIKLNRINFFATTL